MSDPITWQTIGHLIQTISVGPAISLALGSISPVLAATLVLLWHGLRGTDPGPAGPLLLKLVQLVLPGRRRR